MKLNYILCTVALGLLFGSRIGHADENREVAEQLKPLITTSELVVGRNRFAFGLLKANKLLEGADVQLRIYGIEGQKLHCRRISKSHTKPSETSSRSVPCIATQMEQHMCMVTSPACAAFTWRS